ncbi:MAG: hypothetical protein ICV77_09735 [Cyanobacteria bacterium Co-bin8]|nr:hypothetical protein [Cyanobacteria bacterium Co-bin8]
MRPNLRPAIGLAIAIAGQAFFAGCMAPAYAPPLNYSGPYAPGARTYGANGGQITAAKAESIKWLAWPQSYGDMIGALGYPKHRTETSDHYQIEGSDQWLIIFYDGKTATGYSLE